MANDDAAYRWMERIIPLDGSWTLQVRRPMTNSPSTLPPSLTRCFPLSPSQEYVKHPLLYRGRKFDLRVWAVITSIDPLRIYLLDHAFPKVARPRTALLTRTLAVAP